MRFNVTALDSTAAETYRFELASGTRPGRRVTLVESGAPCRHCLRPGATGEEMLLLTHQPFAGDSPYAVPSPIFIHASACARYETPDELPLLLRNGLRGVRSYDADTISSMAKSSPAPTSSHRSSDSSRTSAPSTCTSTAPPPAASRVGLTARHSRARDEMPIGGPFA